MATQTQRTSEAEKTELSEHVQVVDVEHDGGHQARVLEVRSSCFVCDCTETDAFSAAFHQLDFGHEL
jgi:hypothetical protein